MQACEVQLETLKQLLLKIELSSGLKVNFLKSCLVPINVSSDKTSPLANCFGCSVGAMPFTYLGLPMGTTKPLVKDYPVAPGVCRVHRAVARQIPRS
jgi:hypothetical protein